MAESNNDNLDAKGRFAKGNDTGQRFKPGQSGNPKGPPKAKTQLWRYVCLYLDMNDIKFNKLKNKKKLKQAQQAAIKIVEGFKSGKKVGNERMAKYLIDRDEGRAVETLQISSADPLTEDECEDIREILKNNAK